jgi:hypothetical protein
MKVFLLCSFLLFAMVSSAQAQYVANVTAKILYIDGTKFEGTAILWDLTNEVAVKTWTIDPTGTVQDTITLNPSLMYRIDLLDLGGTIRESSIVLPGFLPVVKSATFTFRLTRILNPDGKTYLIREVKADLKF